MFRRSAPKNHRLPESSGNIILGGFFLRIRKDLLCIAKLHHLSHIEKCRLITDTGGLLHVVRHNHNGIPFFQFMNQFFHLCRRCCCPPDKA